MINEKVLGEIQLALHNYNSALVSRVGRDAKKTALANLLINNAEDLIETCKDVPALMDELTQMRGQIADLEQKLSAATAPKGKPSAAKNG